MQDSGIPGFEQLFNDSIRRRIKQDFLARQAPEEATFRPRINTSSVALRHLVEGRQGAGSSGEQSGDVSARWVSACCYLWDGVTHLIHGAQTCLVL